MNSDGYVILLLCGGQSSRMGVDKALLQISGERLVDKLIGRLENHSNQILISGPVNYGTQWPNMPDISSGPCGPMAALYTAWHVLRHDDGIKGVVTIPIDGPNFPEDLIGRLTGQNYSSIACDENRIHPTFAYWRLQELETVFKRALSDEKISLTRLSQKIGAKKILWLDETLFFNINDPNDLNTYLTAII